MVSPFISDERELYLTLDPKAGYRLLEIIDPNGAVVMKENITDRGGRIHTLVPPCAPGMYLFRLSGDTGSYTHKLVIP
jgi:hypothetical protein